MGRKVFVTSDISVDESLLTIAEQDPLSTLIWPWILTALDDWGRAEAKPRMLKFKVFPGNNMVTAESIESALRLYHEVGLIELYEVTGRTYLSIPHDKWFKYQTHIRKEKRNIDESRYPAPPSARVIAELRENCMQNEPEYLQNEPSPSPSPSPSLINNDDDDNAQAREEIKNRALETNQEEPKNPVLAKGVKAVEDDFQQLSVVSMSIANNSNTEEHKSPICALGSRAIAYAEANFGRLLSPAELHGISDYCMEFATRASPDPDAVVIEALKRCIENDQRKMSYLRGILVDWLDHGVKDLSHISQRDKEWAAQKIKTITKSKRGDGNAKNLRDTKPRINDSSTYNPAAWAAAGYSVST